MTCRSGGDVTARIGSFTIRTGIRFFSTFAVPVLSQGESGFIDNHMKDIGLLSSKLLTLEKKVGCIFIHSTCVIFTRLLVSICVV